MADVTVTVTPAQIRALKRLDAVQTAREVLQAHVDTWLLPYVDQLDVEDYDAIRNAYRSASPAVRSQVRTDLGL